MSATDREVHAANSREWQDQFTMCGSGQWHRGDETCDCLSGAPK